MPSTITTVEGALGFIDDHLHSELAKLQRWTFARASVNSSRHSGMENGLTNYKELATFRDAAIMDWQPTPFERVVELAMINPDGTVHSLEFPCFRTFDGWLCAKTKRWVNVRPTHWRAWEERI